MTPAEFNARCSIARTLEVLGEKWTFLILREALRGQTRFSGFRDSLGVAKDVLADRLGTLVAHGVMEKRSYKSPGERERDEYVLTESGAALRTVLGALTEWGDAYRPTEVGPTVQYVEASSGEPVRLEFVTSSGRLVEPAAVTGVFTEAALAG